MCCRLIYLWLLHVRLFENKANFQLLSTVFSTEFQNAISIPLWIDWKFNTKYQSASGNRWWRYLSTNHSSAVLSGPSSHPLWALKTGDFPHTCTFLRKLLVWPSAFFQVYLSAGAAGITLHYCHHRRSGDKHPAQMNPTQEDAPVGNGSLAGSQTRLVGPQPSRG